MDVTATVTAPCPPDALFAEVGDLTTYPEWLGIVTRVREADADPGDPGPAWHVDLRGRIGPLARSKRLRMVRTAFDPPRTLRMERRELDGRSHSPWVLEAVVAPDGGGSRLDMLLHYGGSFGGALLRRMLDEEIDRSRDRLLDRVG